MFFCLKNHPFIEKEIPRRYAQQKEMSTDVNFFTKNVNKMSTDFFGWMNIFEVFLLKNNK